MRRASNTYPPLGVPLLIAIAASCAIAYAAPFDNLFDTATLGSPMVRAVAMLGLWGIGLWLQQANGLSLSVVDLSHPFFKIAAAAIVVAIWCFTLDAIVFRDIIPPEYAALKTTSLAFRLLYFCTRALNENVLYRLVLGPLLAWIICKVWSTPKPTLAIAMAGMVVAQIVNIAANMPLSDELSPATAAWLILRFVMPGVAWGWLYVRHGFVANEAAAITVHWFLQPMVSLAGRLMP